MTRRFVLAHLIALLAGLGLLAVSIWYFNAWKSSEVTIDDDVLFIVEPGESFRHIAFGLMDTGLLERPRMFHILGLLEGELASIQAGEYAFAHAASPSSILEKLTSGDVVKHHIRFPEGGTFRQFKRLLEAEDKLTLDIDDVSVENVLNFLESSVEHTGFGEGWFYPDTYIFQMGEKASEILGIAHQKMIEVLDTAWTGRASGEVLANRYELLILASLIEKETSKKEEKSLISGVFCRRLLRNMKLQADPTVIYGLGEEFDGDLNREHLRRPNKYNTYINLGLPPSPIAAPSEETLLAAAHPAQGDELYFVGRGDGTTHFSSTLAEHNEAVKRFQLGERD